jgi:hypothetical protein
MNRRLDHEKLEVYQASLAFIAWLEPILRLGLPEEPEKGEMARIDRTAVTAVDW